MILDREELIRKYRAIHTAEAQFVALCIEQYNPKAAAAEPPSAFKVVADHFRLAAPNAEDRRTPKGE